MSDKTNLKHILIVVILAILFSGGLVWQFLLVPKESFSAIDESNLSKLPTKEITETYDPKWFGEYVPVMKGEAANYNYADPDALTLPSGYRLYVEEMGKHQIVSFFSKDGINWSRETGVRVHNAAFADAIYLPDGRVRIYFQGFKAINSAISNDEGLSFTAEDGARVPTGWHGELDVDNVAAPSVVRLIDGRYRMYYIGRKIDVSYCNNVKHVILSAISNDGLNFSPENGVRVAPEDWPITAQMKHCKWSYIDGPEVVLTSEGNTKLYFWGACDGICLSTSKDGLKFERVGSIFSNTQLPTAPKGNAGDPATLQLKDAQLLFYNSVQNNYQSVFIAKQVASTIIPLKTSVETPQKTKEPEQESKKKSSSIEYKFPPVVNFVDTARDGPWSRDLWVTESSDATNFKKAKIFVERAGVPSITRDNKDRLVVAFQWFPKNNKQSFDQVALVFSKDYGKTWSQPQPMKIANFPQGYMRPFDPTIISIPNGKIRMYFTSKPQASQPSIFSAISEDGINYIFEPGERFGVRGEMVIDSAVGRIGNTWHLLSPVNIKGTRGTAYHAVSTDGLSFSTKPNIKFQKDVNWIGNLLLFNNGLRFYGSSPKIWWTFTQKGEKWTEPKYTNIVGGDPAIIKLSNKKYLMIYVGQSKKRLN